MNELKNYIEQLLENVADECNVKEVILKVDDEKSVYSFDTLKRKSIGADDNFTLFSLVFTGDIREDMAKVRKYVNDGLRNRAKAGIKIRQPLQSITIGTKA